MYHLQPACIESLADNNDMKSAIVDMVKIAIHVEYRIVITSPKESYN